MHQLKVDAKLCSVFLADVLCLVNILIWLPYRWPTCPVVVSLQLRVFF